MTLDFITLVIRLSLSPQEKGGYLSHGYLFPDFRETKKSHRAPAASAVSQVILILKNQYATVGYLGRPALA